MRKEIRLTNGKSFWVESYTGEVIESNAWSETEVRSRQNVGFVHSSGVVVGGGTSVSSTTTEVREFWLRLEDGREKHFKFKKMFPTTRTGHKVTVVMAGAPDQTDGAYLLVHEHTTGEVIDFLAKNETMTMYATGVFSFPLFALRIFAYIGLVFMLIGFFADPVIMLLIHFKRMPIKADFRRQIKEAMPSLLPTVLETRASTMAQAK